MTLLQLGILLLTIKFLPLTLKEMSLINCAYKESVPTTVGGDVVGGDLVLHKNAKVIF